MLHEAIAAGADTLVSGGVVQSNSQRQVAAAAAKLGLDCHLAVYHGRLAPPSADYDKTGNALLNRLFGATLHDVPWNGDRNGAIRALADRLRAEGRSRIVVPYGVSNRDGRRGLRLDGRSRSRSSRRAPASRRRPSSTAPAAPARRPGWWSARASACRTRASSASTSMPSPSACRPTCSPTAARAAELLDQPFDEADVEVVAGHAGPAYGVPHQATVEAIRLGARLEALVLDPVYSGKGLAGLIALIRDGRWTKDQDVVFIHTGGAPALFAYRHLFD